MNLDGGHLRVSCVETHDVHGKSSGSRRREGGYGFLAGFELHHELLLVFVDVQRRTPVRHNPQGHIVAFDDVEHDGGRNEAALIERNPERLGPGGGAIGPTREHRIQADERHDRSGQQRQRTDADSIQGRSRIGSCPTIDLPMVASAFVNRTIWNPLSWLVNQSSVSAPRLSQRMFEEAQSVVRFSDGRFA